MKDSVYIEEKGKYSRTNVMPKNPLAVVLIISIILILLLNLINTFIYY